MTKFDLQEKKIWPDKKLVRMSILIPILISSLSAGIIFFGEYNLDAIYKFLKITGESMLIMFMLSFGASTAYYFFPNKFTRWILRQRKYSGIAFSVFFFIHFFGLFLKMVYDTPFFIKDTTIPEYILGVIAIVFTGGMALTSNDKSQKELGIKKWSLLHTVGGNCLLFGFWITYYDHELNHLPVFLLINGLIILRSLRRILFMRKIKRMNWLKITPILILVLAGGLIAVSVQEHDQDISEYAGREFKASEYYPLYEGNTWVYRVDDSNQNSFIRKFQIRGRENTGGQDTWKVYFSPEGYKCFTYDETGIRKYKEFDEGSSEIYDPPSNILPDLSFNVLKTFYSKYSKPDEFSQGSVIAEGRIEFKITGVEDVTVKAGRFMDCIRVEYYDKWVESDGTFDITTSTAWFAKQVGIVKEISQLKKVDPRTKKTSRYLENAELIEVVIRGGRE